MSMKLTPSKRPHDRSPAEANGRAKWQKSASFSSERSPPKVRILCPASNIDFLIGEDSSVISQIRDETGVEVRVEDSTVGCDERVIVIESSEKENEVGNEQLQADAGGSEIKEKDSRSDENGDKGENKVVLPVENAKTEKEALSVQKALFLVFDRMIEGGVEMNGGDEQGNNSSSLIIRLLVLSSQVGCLLGKGGSVMKQMSSESGAQIQVLPKDKRPSCASSSDEVVQIFGGRDAVKKALACAAGQLLENSSWHQDFPADDAGGPSSHSPGHPLSNQELYPLSTHLPFHGQGPPSSVGSRDGEVGIPGRMNPIPDALTFRLLCPDEKVGGIIGKGGSIIKALQHETGCQIKVLDGAGDSEDRVIVISGPAHPDDRITLPQDAVLRIQSRIFRAAPENKDNVMVAKILVFSNQIGCLLGKGGGVIAEMRKSTGAYIRILGKDQTPKCAMENEEVVQINGDFETVREALLQITSRLQNHYFRYAFPSNLGFLDQVPPFPSHMGGGEFSPPGMFSNMRPSFHKFDAVGGLPPHGGFHPHDDRPPFMQNFHRPGIPPHMSDRMPSSAPWGPQGPGEGGFPDYAGGPRSIGSFGGGNHPAVITSTTVEVVVPRSVVPAIYGEGGGCLRQICEISDAKVTINDPKPGAAETVIIISGTPEQTNAAQSLIQAFVMVETEAA